MTSENASGDASQGKFWRNRLSQIPDFFFNEHVRGARGILCTPASSLLDTRYSAPIWNWQLYISYTDWYVLVEQSVYFGFRKLTARKKEERRGEEGGLPIFIKTIVRIGIICFLYSYDRVQRERFPQNKRRLHKFEHDRFKVAFSDVTIRLWSKTA